MIALIWKELQENVKWAALPLLVCFGLMAFMGLPGLMVWGGLLVLSLISATYGAALGFVQVYFDGRGDRRALLLHRPMSHSRIFLAKAFVGVALYLLGSGIPFAYVVFRSATPGSLAEPFRWAMTLPWLADMLTGLVFYFAGMVMGGREARWYGSRGLSVAAAFACSMAVWMAAEFWQAIVAIALLGGPVAVAAWGSFLTGGRYAPQPRVARFALASTFLVGLLLIGLIVKTMVGGALWGASWQSYYTLDREGRVLLVRWKPAAILNVTDLDGQEPAALQGKLLDSSAIRDIEAPQSASVLPRFHTYRSPGEISVRCRNDSSSRDEDWTYVADRGRVLGYDERSKRTIGSIGPDGFVSPDQESRHRFHGETYYGSYMYDAGSAYYLALPDGVYLADFKRRSVQPVFTPGAGEKVLGATRWKDERLNVSRAVVLTDQALHVLEETGASLLAAPLALPLEDYGIVQVARLENPQRFAIWYEPSWHQRTEEGKNRPCYLVEYDATGRECARRSVPPLPLIECAPGEALFGLFTPIAEALGIAGATQRCVAASRLAHDREIEPVYFVLTVPTRFFIPGAGREMTATGSVLLAFRLLILLSALACGLTTFLLARRHGYSPARQFAWLACGLLFGPLGLLLMLALQEWPARLVCPQCGKLRVVTQERCQHCGAPQPPPERDGTEIFEAVARTEAAAMAGSNP